MRTLYRLLLRLLPSHYGRNDRAEMLGHFDDVVERSRRAGGVAPVFRAGLAEVADLARAVLGSWLTRGLLDALRQDLGVALRSVARDRLIWSLAVASLALGIGASTAIFSALDVWLIRPLPLPEPDRLVSVAMANRDEGWSRNVFSPRDFLEWREATTSMDLAVYRQGSSTLDQEGRAEPLDVLRASANLLDVLGYRPSLGRGFRPEEERPGSAPVVVLSDGFWRRAMGADPSVLGRSVTLGARAYTVVGVLEPGAGFEAFRGDVWIPLRFSDDPSRDGHSLHGVARLRDDVSLSAAREELERVADLVALNDPDRTFPDASVLPLRDAIYGTEFEQGGLVLGISVLFVLLIACANIANLLLARGVTRTHEMAIRGALGADRGRLVRQLLTESLLLAVFGGLAGVGIGYFGIEALRTWVLPPDVPGWGRIALDGRVMTAAAAFTVFSALVFGLVPALRLSDVDLRSRLVQGSRGMPSAGRRRLATALVVVEIALALVLLTNTGLVVGSLVKLSRTDLGFPTEGALTFRLTAPEARAPDGASVLGFHDDVLETLRDLSGVTGVAAASGRPVGNWSTFLYSEAAGEGSGEPVRRSAENRVVTPSYFQVMGMRLLAGRSFSEQTDVPGAPTAAVVSRTLAETHWGSADDALGRRLAITPEEEVLVVGVVEAGRMRGPHREPPLVVFRSLGQSPARLLFYVVRAEGRPEELVAPIRGVLRSVDPTGPARRIRSLEATIDDALEPDRAILRILGTLAGIALVLTLVGVYGVVAHSVGQRRREMGLRLALGADSGKLVRMVLRKSVLPALLGLAAGAGFSLLLGRSLASLLAGVDANDPAVLLGVTGLLFAAVVVAAAIPARRAVRVDPVRSLSAE